MNTINGNNHWLESFKQVMFSARRPVEAPQTIISTPNGRMATKGNLIGISGLPKCGKSSLAGAIIAGSITRVNKGIDTLGLEIKQNSELEGVIYINTDLSLYDFDLFNRNILRRAGLKQEPSNFRSFNFVGEEPQELLTKTRIIIEEVNYKHSLRLIVIDGLADYVWNVNSIDESNMVVAEMIRIANDYNCVVLAVIHTNPGLEGKVRGHLGSQFERKCETLLEVKKSKSGISTVSQKLMRNAGDFYPILFNYDDEKGYHVFLGTKAELQESKKEQREENKVEDYKSLLIKIFENRNEITPSELTKSIIQAASVRIDRAKQLIRIFKKLGLIEKNVGLYSPTDLM